MALCVRRAGDDTVDVTRRRLLVAGSAMVLVLGTLAVLLRGGGRDDASSVNAGAGTSTTGASTTTTTTTSTSTTSTTTTTSTSPTQPTTTTTARPTTTTFPTRVVAGRLPMLMPLEVVAIDARTAWVVGSSDGTGVFARTGDGGRTWSWTCTGRLLTGVSAIDGRRGVVVSAGAGGARPLLYTTVDGGRTFATREIDVPIDVVTTVDFTDERTGVIAGTALDPDRGSTGVVASTADGGSTWRVRTYPGVQIEDVIDRPGQPHLAVGSRGQHPPVVLDLDAADGSAPIVIEDLAHLRGVVAHDGRLIAVGASKADADGLLAGPSVVRSDDGGRTWRAMTSSPAANLYAIEVSPAGELWASGQVGYGPAVLVSSDGGAVWTARHTSGSGGAFTTLSNAGTSVWTLGYQPGLAVAADAAPVDVAWLTVPIGPTPSC
jgi:hypothetical protein